MVFYSSKSYADEMLIKYQGFMEQIQTPSIIIAPNGKTVNLVKVRARLMGSSFQSGDTLALNLKTNAFKVFKRKDPVNVLKTERQFAKIKLTQNVALAKASKPFFTVDNPLSDLNKDGGIVFAGKFNKAAYRSSKDLNFSKQDFDQDNTPNASDNCLTEFNPEQTDTDGDDSGNACDDDDDNDQLNDSLDNCPLLANQNQLDTDDDSEGDACDADDDNDSIDDISDNCDLIQNINQTDTDSDQSGDACDNDDDNDGVFDQDDINSLNPLICRDNDMDSCDDCSIGVDGFGALQDFDVSNDGPDLDGDTQCDIGDPDIDGDDFFDTIDNCPRVFNPEQTDSNRNGTGDLCEIPSSAEDELCVPIVLKNSKVVLVCL